MTRRSWPFVVAVAAQLVILYAPRAPSAGQIMGVDKVVHVVVFALVVATGLRSSAPCWLVLVVSVVQAPVSEALQAALLPHRSGDPLDVLADLVGAAVGWWLTRGAIMVR